MKKIFYIFSVGFIIYSCNSSQPDMPKNVEEVVKLAGSNKDQFLNVIRHYQKNKEDSLKLKAAYFLIGNMQGVHFYEGELLDAYMEYPKMIRHSEEDGAYILNFFNTQYGGFNYDKIKKVYDIEIVKSADIINNIEMAFKVWREQPWGKKYSFNDFCEYILPFRFVDAKPENNRKEIYLQFNSLLDSVRHKNGNAVEACIALNKKLEDDKWLFTTRVSFLPHFPSSSLIKYRTGTCDAMGDLGTYVMRSVGIPIGNDFVPQWPNGGSGHNWNIVLDERGKFIPFLATEDSPGAKHKPGTKKGKIYRKTYALNPESLAMIKDSNDIVPRLFTDPKMKDVTDHYVKTFSFDLKLNSDGDRKFAFLSVFNNKEWIPIAWANIQQNATRFEKIEGGIVYLPVYFGSNGTMPARLPIILKENGVVEELKPKLDKEKSIMKLTRIYPDLPDDFWLYELDGGSFQGSNNLNFESADLLYRIKGKPESFLDSTNLVSDKKYRYVRYLSARNMFCDISELKFYGAKDQLKGQIIGSDDVFKDNPQYNHAMAMDGDYATVFKSKNPSGSWVGLDLQKPVAIKKIKFAAKMNAKPDSFITPGQEYELFYWDNDWISIGVQTAKSKSLVFNTNVSNALFLVKNLSKSVKERIFTYNNGHQIWW